MARLRSNPFRYFNSSPEVIRLAVMLYVCHPFSLRNAQGPLHERGIDICHETVSFCWNPLWNAVARDIRKRRVRAIECSLGISSSQRLVQERAGLRRLLVSGQT